MSDRSYSNHQLALKLAVESYGDQTVAAYNDGSLEILANAFYNYMYCGRMER